MGCSPRTVPRSRQHPPEFGRASTFVETTKLPVNRGFVRAVLAAINYCGLVEISINSIPMMGGINSLILMDEPGATIRLVRTPGWTSLICFSPINLGAQFKLVEHVPE